MELDHPATRSVGRRLRRPTGPVLGCLVALASLVCCAVALYSLFVTFHTALHGQGSAEDFVTYRAGAQALRSGSSIYRVRAFVYPPTSALLFLPFSLGRTAGAFDVWMSLSAAALAVGCVIAVWPPPRRWRPLAAACLITLVAKSDLAVDNVPVGNLSVGLTPIAVGALILLERGRWARGIALLLLSMLVKPLLIALLVLPVLRGHGRSLLSMSAVTAGVLIAASLLVPGGTDFPSVIPRLIGGSNLVGTFAGANLSLSGLGDRLHEAVIFDVLRVAAGALGLAAIWRWSFSASASLTPSAGVAALMALFLAGSLSQGHYVLMSIPCVILALIEAGSMAASMVGGVGLIVLLYPSYDLGGVGGGGLALQVRDVIGQAVLLMASVVALWSSSTREADEPVSTEKGGDAPPLTRECV